jgi:hypothetical protein
VIRGGVQRISGFKASLKDKFPIFQPYITAKLKLSLITNAKAKNYQGLGQWIQLISDTHSKSSNRLFLAGMPERSNWSDLKLEWKTVLK